MTVKKHEVTDITFLTLVKLSKTVLGMLELTSLGKVSGSCLCRHSDTRALRPPQR